MKYIVYLIIIACISLFFLHQKYNTYIPPLNTIDSLQRVIQLQQDSLKQKEDSFKNRKIDTLVIKKIIKTTNEKKDSIISLPFNNKVKFISDKLSANIQDSF
jgi:hypothetical protein